MGFKTEQESFWQGDFGNEYTKRNVNLVKNNIAFFTKALYRTVGIKSIIEFGCNRGMNLQAMDIIFPQDTEISAVEINKSAVEVVKELGITKDIYNTSILEFTPEYQRDLSFIKGVLIHINPDFLQDVYQKIYDSSSKYILVSEYYNPTPVEIDYRGHDGKLFKRDFAGEMMDKFSDLELIDYGFVYHRDPWLTTDDENWFLFRKK